jgi:hypothetical protein
MKGEVFNLLEEFIVHNSSEDTALNFLEDAAPNLITQEPFIGPGTYPDSDFQYLLTGAVFLLKLPLESTIRQFGKFCFPRLIRKVPEFINVHSNPKSFLATLHSVVHVEVKKLYADARPPDFEYFDNGPNRAIMHYRSQRKFHAFAEGLFEGLAEHFNMQVRYTRTAVVEGADSYIRFELEFY